MSHGKKTFSENYYIDVLPAFAPTGTTPVGTPWVYLGNFLNAAFIVGVGVGDKPIAVKFQVSADAAGTTPVDVAGAATTDFTATDDGKFKVLEVEMDKVPAGYPYGRFLVTPAAGGTGALVGGMVIATPRHVPQVSANLLERVTFSG